MKDISEATAPSKVVKKILERDVQGDCVDWARRRGYWARKFSSMTQRSVPDYLFGRMDTKWFNGQRQFPNLRIKFACEFKAPGKTSTQAQIDEQAAMRLAGWFVF